MATAIEVAASLGISERHFHRLVAAGLFPPRGSSEGWDLVDCEGRALDYNVALALVRGAAGADLGIDYDREITLLRWLALHRGAAPADLGIDDPKAVGNVPWDRSYWRSAKRKRRQRLLAARGW